MSQVRLEEVSKFIKESIGLTGALYALSRRLGLSVVLSLLITYLAFDNKKELKKQLASMADGIREDCDYEDVAWLFEKKPS